MTLLVIGASSDMGIAAIRSIENNYEYILAHYFHMNKRLSTLKDELGEKLILLQADLSKDEEINELIKQVKQLNLVPSHILHFPAQQIKIQKFHKTDWAVMGRGIDISVKSLVRVLQTCLPQMIKARYGKIVIVLSYVLDGMPPKYSADYVMTKYALLGLVKALAVEYAEKGIIVNGVSPAFTETRFVENMHDYFKEENEKASPIGRNLVVNDIIPTIAFLLSEGSDCINGQNISITCGRQ